MAPPAGTLRVGRYLLALLALLAILYSIVGFGSRHSPKLGLDLVGGVRVIFTAQTPKGSPPPTPDQMTQARQILEDRINSTGVTGATVIVQGSNQLVVEIPNGTSTDVARLGKAAILNFRPVIAPAQAIACSNARSASSSGSASSGASPSPTASPGAAGASHSGAAASERPLAAPKSTTPAAKSSAAPSSAAKTSAAKSSAASSSAATASGSASGSASASSTPTPVNSASTALGTRCYADPFATLAAKGIIDNKLASKLPNAETCPSPGLDSSTCVAYDTLTAPQQQDVATALQHVDCAAAQTEPDIVDRAYFACDTTGQIAYLMGHVVVPGRLISSASAQAPNVSNGETQWTVALTLGSAGGNRWNAWTSKYHTDENSATNASPTSCGPSASLPCSDFVGFTLDGQVISAPVTLAILDQRTSISGNFTQSSANELARELNYGKLPVSFRADAVQNTSPTLGRSQLHAAFLAGGIGLLLVIIYSLIYYRALGLVTIASLVVSAALIYAMLVVLGQQLGYTLDLAGIAGFIVALGITADSFVVFFERLKDEVHEGRTARVAVPRAWVRARRTILSADTVSFLAAAILYYFASADVKGFAFTLGMSTILDLVVVFLFTHPMVSLLARSKTFSSARFTGLQSVRPAYARSSDLAAPASGSGAGEPARAEAATATAVLERPDDAPRPSGRGAPEPGSAAERAAARRARLRQQRDQDGGR